MIEPDPLVHLGADGSPCATHGPATTAAIMALASIGARMSAFNHDIASKLQGLMMSIDELDELVARTGDPDLRSALDTAHASLKELSALLTANRALTRGTKPTRTTLREVVRHAVDRTGTQSSGQIVEVPLECSIPAISHAIALALEVCAGAQRLRSIKLASDLHDGFAQVTLAINGAPPANASELLALATFGLAREGGTLHCTPAAIVIRLPVAR